MERDLKLVMKKPKVLEEKPRGQNEVSIKNCALIVIMDGGCNSPNLTSIIKRFEVSCELKNIFLALRHKNRNLSSCEAGHNSFANNYKPTG